MVVRCAIAVVVHRSLVAVCPLCLRSRHINASVLYPEDTRFRESSIGMLNAIAVVNMCDQCFII